MSTFQIIVLSIFGLLIVAGVLVFAGYGGLGGKTVATPQVTMWGTLPATDINDMLNEMDKIKQGILKVTYVQKDPTTYDRDFTEAVAEGKGPDIIVISDDQILSERNKLIPIPFTTLSDREMKDTFVSEASIFSTSKGYLAVPFTIDPLVMYWNRSIFQSAGLSQPPAYWDEFPALIPLLTKKDQASNIQKSAISFGEFQNVENAKEIISTLIFQAGNPITLLDNSDTEHPDKVQSILDQNPSGSTISPAEAALDFYTQFADPSKSVFSWNRSLPLSTNSFLSGDLATYFGFASEYLPLKEKNPNLDFDVTSIPQPRSSTTKITFGHISGLALAKNTKDVNGAYSSIRILTGNTALGILSTINNLPTVRRDLLASTTAASIAAQTTFNAAALQSSTWFDPDSVQTDKAFSDMIESIKSGSQKTSEAIGTANVEIQNLIH